MIRKYKITLVGSEEPNGSRTISTKADPPCFADILFAVDEKYLADYVPNAGDTLIRDDSSGSISFESQEAHIPKACILVGLGVTAAWALYHVYAMAHAMQWIPG